MIRQVTKTDRAVEFLRQVKATPEPWNCVDATHLTPAERCWLVEQGCSFSTTRVYNQIVGMWPQHKRAEELRAKVQAKLRK